MNVVLKKQLSRRTILRGVGTAIALPFLDAMIPAFGAKSKAPTRMAFVYFPNGVQMDSWTPQTEGEIAKLPEALPRVLEPLAPYREHINVLGGLTVDGGRAHGDGPGDHGRAGASYLTGAHPKKTFGRDIQAGISVDQYAAHQSGRNAQEMGTILPAHPLGVYEPDEGLVHQGGCLQRVAASLPTHVGASQAA